MKTVVLGNGTMGAGIAQLFAQNGYDVVMKGRRDESLNRAMAKLEKGLNRQVEKGRMTEEDMKKVLGHITTSTDMNVVKDADLVIEAVSEDMEMKKEMLKEVDSIQKEGGIIATNTSSLSITDIASATNRPEHFIGMHFFNPVRAMKLVEVISGQKTSKETLDFTIDLCEKLGKTPVKVDEAPGFVVNRMLIPMINEGIGIYADGVASIEEIDTAMKLGANHPMGPLALADYIGLDVCLAIMDVLYTEYGDPKYRAHVLLRKMVRAGELGMKTGKGFYTY